MTNDSSEGTDVVTDDVDDRVTEITMHADLAAVAQVLAASREPLLRRWLAVTARQPFHTERPDLAVADHIPELFDAIVALLARAGSVQVEPDAPLEDPAIEAAATSHAVVRFEQGLGPVAIVTEFRLLRHEIGRALRTRLNDDMPASDVVAGLTLVSDAIDGSAAVGLAALSNRIETLRESFLATTLHDVRQPITLLQGSLHLADRWLAGDSADTPKVHQSVRDALSATAELIAMIDAMSDASRLAMGELTPDLEPASLEEIARLTVATFGETARTRVTLDIPDARLLIGLWDAGLIRRVVVNLVGNALKYSGPDGLVHVAVGAGTDGFAELTVSDVGLGLTEEELMTAFERFSRSDRVREHGLPGLGLGLYACRGIVAAHGGTIELRSDGVGRGTTAFVRLPLHVEEDPGE
jgi:signal transduction histidine kinase